MQNEKLKVFNDIYNLHYRKCFLFAKSYVHSVEIADDIASEGMMKLWKNLQDASDEIKNTEAYLLTVIKNLSLNHLRNESTKWDIHKSISDATQREIELRISTLEACNPDVLFSNEVHRIYEQTLALLPEQTRRVFTMSRTDDKSNKEIAIIMGISVKGIDYHISKAIKALRKNLKDYLPSILF